MRKQRKNTAAKKAVEKVKLVISDEDRAAIEKVNEEYEDEIYPKTLREEITFIHDVAMICEYHFLAEMQTLFLSDFAYHS